LDHQFVSDAASKVHRLDDHEIDKALSGTEGLYSRDVSVFVACPGILGNLAGSRLLNECRAMVQSCRLFW
jgi:hypothetical protein